MKTQVQLTRADIWGADAKEIGRTLYRGRFGSEAPAYGCEDMKPLWTWWIVSWLDEGTLAVFNFWLLMPIPPSDCLRALSESQEDDSLSLPFVPKKSPILIRINVVRRTHDYIYLHFICNISPYKGSRGLNLYRIISLTNGILNEHEIVTVRNNQRCKVTLP